jgi:hypothetical protein
MRRRTVVAASVAVCLVLAGSGFGVYYWSRTIRSMTLYSLDGTFFDRVAQGEAKVENAGDNFHGYPILGKVEIKSPRDRIEILQAIERGMADNKDREGTCFWPRHGVRLVRGRQTVDFVICFTCLQLEQYVNGEHLSHDRTTEAPAVVLDRYLKAAGVPQQERP